MGIFPYFSPEEHKAMKDRIAHCNKFIRDKGFVSCYYWDANGISTRDWPYITPEGLVCQTAKDYYLERGYYPCYDKDGITYSYVEAREGYQDPCKTEMTFIKSKGYKRCKGLSEDHIENINLQEAHYKEFGYVPRWKKDGQTFDTKQVLKRENFTH